MRALLVLVLALALSGCGTLPTGGGKAGVPVVQRLLDDIFPAQFTGDVHVEHSNPYFGFTLDVGNLRRGPNGWLFDWLVLDRHGFTKGKTRLGNPPPRPL